MTTTAKDRDRALAQAKSEDFPAGELDIDNDDEVGLEDPNGLLTGQDALGSKVIVIHPGSQNLRIVLASDAPPKTIPMVIARKWRLSGSEEGRGEPRPKRLKLDDSGDLEPEKIFGDDFAKQYTAICAELKIHMRNNKRRVLPNNKELVVNYRRTKPEIISERNDPLHIYWTELPNNRKDAPGNFTGKAALRIPDTSNPRYKLSGHFSEDGTMSMTIARRRLCLKTSRP
ncbi:actin-like protein arp8 [Peltigera leucophlebia]|nr:actin-like protein arp8 [Peltigera leucophlebia]